MNNPKNLKSGLHAIIWEEKPLFIAKCIEVEVASQGGTRQEALSNLEEALELYFENEKAPLPGGLINPEVLPLNLKISYA